MSMEPMRIDFAQATGDDAWRIEFKAESGQRLVWIDNVPAAAAREVYARWSAGSPSRLVSCQECPVGPSSCRCQHAAPAWSFQEITNLRIMPMRESL